MHEGRVMRSTKNSSGKNGQNPRIAAKKVKSGRKTRSGSHEKAFVKKNRKILAQNPLNDKKSLLIENIESIHGPVHEPAHSGEALTARHIAANDPPTSGAFSFYMDEDHAVHFFSKDEGDRLAREKGWIEISKEEAISLGPKIMHRVDQTKLEADVKLPA